MKNDLQTNHLNGSKDAATRKPKKASRMKIIQSLSRLVSCCSERKSTKKVTITIANIEIMH